MCLQKRIIRLCHIHVLVTFLGKNQAARMQNRIHTTTLSYKLLQGICIIHLKKKINCIVQYVLLVFNFENFVNEFHLFCNSFTQLSYL